MGRGSEKFSKVKLPRCNYSSAGKDKENLPPGNSVNKNLSYVGKLSERLPPININRSGSCKASDKMPKMPKVQR